MWPFARWKTYSPIKIGKMQKKIMLKETILFYAGGSWEISRHAKKHLMAAEIYFLAKCKE